MPTDTLTDERVTEILATKGMGWDKQDHFVLRGWFRHDTDMSDWSPLEDLNAVREVEERLTDEQWHKYWLLMVPDDSARAFRNFKAGRHAPARICAYALAEVLENK